ncbi:Adaptin N terminal region family protein [Trichomonas vaginalis G3]|uniref:AP-1 complex subunit gamma n=1 Tax=Trichomonas vaginalis (strain ATCC PRA-98 / G3) TaxID=412133 RepID=A2E7M9_TRIV3|nr:intracellular protein transport [Trichomonas vaginalis G3]EAY11314.1 Adaptin N terminal region family protein [Trichomonas vaginalis G3]KAI5523756.1 intracellular protein transport [Trichomonas vaginalis G3]|eukprot:XP_001323537.1 Adaptin N terminal region family protein [Trichomonas vaginalis G3]
MQSLNDFISSLRMASSIEQEKYLTSTEQAHIRASLKVCEASQRPVIVSKLMFLDLLGHNVQWGNTEVINLMSDEAFSYKRIGYIGAAQLLDAEDDMNVLVTQTLLKDLQSRNPYIQSLALAYIANNASAEICTSVVTEVQRLMQGSPAFVLKRAGMAAVRIVRKNPELCETFKNSVQSLLNNSSHGIVISGLNLVIEMLTINPKLSRAWAQFASPLTKILQNLITGRLRPEYATENFCDPFMQMKTLRALTLLHKKAEETENILQTIINKSDLSSNVGRSIIYEMAETVATVSKSQSTCGLAFNSIGRLLALNDPNALYSALCAFDRVLSRPLKGKTDAMALQRYKSKVAKCLGNDDPSIRRRALSVISALIDETNAETLIPEILGYVKLSDPDFRIDIISKVYQAAMKFKANDRWFISTTLDLLKESGGYVGTDLLSSFCEFVGTTSERSYVIECLSAALQDANSTQPLLQAAAFIVGEYGTNPASIQDISVLIQLPNVKLETRLYLLSALSRIAARIGASQEILPLLTKLQTSNDTEVQQRAGELVRMFEKGIATTVLATDDTQQDDKLVKVDSNQKDDDEEDLLGLVMDNKQTTQTTTPAANTNDILSLIAAAPVVTNVVNKPVVTNQLPPGVVYDCDAFFVKYNHCANAQNPKQHALQLVFCFRKSVSNFYVQYAAAMGWRLQAPQGKAGDQAEQSTKTDVVYVMDAEGKPFGLKVRANFISAGQQIRDFTLDKQ